MSVIDLLKLHTDSAASKTDRRETMSLIHVLLMILLVIVITSLIGFHAGLVTVLIIVGFIVLLVAAGPRL